MRYESVRKRGTLMTGAVGGGGTVVVYKSVSAGLGSMKVCKMVLGVLVPTFDPTFCYGANEAVMACTGRLTGTRWKECVSPRRKGETGS